jgi:hypothetical protein
MRYFTYLSMKKYFECGKMLIYSVFNTMFNNGHKFVTTIHLHKNLISKS